MRTKIYTPFLEEVNKHCKDKVFLKWDEETGIEFTDGTRLEFTLSERFGNEYVIWVDKAPKFILGKTYSINSIHYVCTAGLKPEAVGRVPDNCVYEVQLRKSRYADIGPEFITDKNTNIQVDK